MATLDEETMVNIGGGEGTPSRMTASRSRLSPGGVWRAGLLAAIVAAAGNVLVYTLARTLGVSLVVPMWGSAEPSLLPLELVVVTSVAGAVGGTVVFVLLARFAPGYPRLFLIVALGFLLLSMAGPLALPSTAVATKATLMLMHVVAGVPTIGLLSGRGRR